MQRFFATLLLLSFSAVFVCAENHVREEGTIVRMRMTDCLGSPHALMDALSGSQKSVVPENCPEYVLVTEKVVYVIVGKGSEQLIPLAEVTRFHLQNNEVVIRVDDARHESRFHVKEMVLRPEWEHNQQLEEMEAITAAHQRLEVPAIVNAARQ